MHLSAGRRGIWQQCHLASVLDGDGNATLLLNRESGHPTGPDLAPLGDELSERCNVLVVNVLAGAQRIGLLLGLALCCRGRGHCGALLSSPARHTQPIAGMCLRVGVELSDQNGGSSLCWVAQGSEPCWVRAPAAAGVPLAHGSSP